MVRLSKYGRGLSNVGLPTTLLAAIGHVAALWAQIEYTIDLKINEALALRDAPKINPKLMIPFNKRLEVLDALCRRFLENPDDRISAAKIVQDLKQLSSLRNLIVHGSIRNSEQRRKGRRVYWFRRMSWDTKPRVVERRALTVADVERFAAKLSDRYAYSTMFEVYFWGVPDAPRDKA